MNPVKASERFNQMVDFYDKFRPEYPKEIIEYIIRKAKLKSGSKMLEIGCGSGKATAQFLGNGFNIQGIDPGVDLVNKGNNRFKNEDIKFFASRFEDYPALTNYYDVIFSAQAFHWVEQPNGYIKCADILKVSGFLAMFWNIDVFSDNEYDNKLWSIITKYNGCVSCMQEDDYKKRVQKKVIEINECKLFKNPEVIHSYWQKIYTLNEYFGYMLTSQVFIENTDEDKKSCYDELALLFDEFDGTIKRQYTCELYIAQKSSI